MQKQFVSPMCSIIVLDSEDIVRTSNGIELPTVPIGLDWDE